MRLFAIACAVFGWGLAAAAEWVWIEDGVCQAPIIVFSNPPPKILRAANELADYVERITDVRPPVIEGLPAPLPERAVWVGFQPVLETLFPSIDFAFAHPEEILIAVESNHVAVVGRDRWDPDQLVVPGRNWTIVGKQFEYGTINAVYTLLQDYLDVRWIWPGPLGVDVLRRDRIALAPVEYRYHPQIRYREGFLRLSALGDARGHSHEWARFQRLQLDSLQVPGGHAFTDWWDRFHETHREYFALQPDGARSGFPEPRTVKMCLSNSNLWTQWMADVASQIQKDPLQRTFNASENDSWMRGFCVCPYCKAWDHPDGELRFYSWDGTSSWDVALSDRQVTFANRLASMLKTQYPDREYYVAMHAYGNSRPAPVAAVPETNVVITGVFNFFLRRGIVDSGSLLGTTAEEQFEQWSRVTTNLVWRPNTGSPAGWNQAQPDVPLSDVIDSIRFAADHRCMGIFVDTVWEHWATHGPLYYVAGQLLWNPERDGHALLADYYQRGFGPAAAAVAAYWQLMEDTRQTFVAGTNRYWEVYDANRFAQAYALLDLAADLTADQPNPYGQRVAFVRAGLEYTRLVIETRELMAQYEASLRRDYAPAAQALLNWEAMERIAIDYPYSLRWSFLRPTGDRMSALYPHDIPDPPLGDRFVALDNPLAASPYTNWTTAAASIQEAVDAAYWGETVWVAPGRYTASANAVSADGALNVVNITQPVVLRAAGVGVLLDGEGAHRTLRAACSQWPISLVLDGLTFTHGYASFGGAAIHATADPIEYRACRFVDNVAGNSGGAIYDNSSAVVTLTHCRFLGNRALTGHGGAIRNRYGRYLVSRSVFEGNRANTGVEQQGGAIWLSQGSRHVIENSVFHDNAAAMSGNASTGGGALMLPSCNLVLRNCLFTGNRGHRGGAINVQANPGQYLELQNCTLSRNEGHSSSFKGAIYLRSGSAGVFSVYNSIIHGNTHADIADIPAEWAVHFFHNCATLNRPADVPDFTLNGNIAINPRFAGPDRQDYRLSRDSPCIDAGINQEWMSDATDLDGNPRIDRTRKIVDMGAYEYDRGGTLLKIL